MKCLYLAWFLSLAGCSAGTIQVGGNGDAGRADAGRANVSIDPTKSDGTDADLARSNGVATCDPGSSGACSSAPGTSCVDGYCLAPSAATCRLADDGIDGCDASSICRDIGNGPHCYIAPKCPANGVCTPAASATGITCNNGVLKRKGAICVPNRCITNADCASLGAECVRKKTTDILGQCERNVITASNALGTAWENPDGCEVSPSPRLFGLSPFGGPCSAPQSCAPTCCSCDGGQSAVLAAQCNAGSGGVGECASPGDTCAAVNHGGRTGTCTAP